MKFIVKMGAFVNQHKYKVKENFYYQHTFIDSFTRLRAIGLAEDSESETAAALLVAARERLPFAIACINNDNGSENLGGFEAHLEHGKICQFFSRSGTPTDNPRVERSHLTDDVEFYSHGNIYGNFDQQEQACLEWERVYNYERPHQALGQLTPMAFFRLWQKNPNAAYAVTEKYRQYLKKQKLRQARSRRLRNKEQIEKLMLDIDQKLSNKSNS